ncbi:MAG TPA: glycosyltransferase family 39 protein [bacterium]|nr:glycosyltransferase family 39 protein [bacterium]
MSTRKTEAFLRAGLLLLVAASTLPFLNHAYHIDEPFFLRIARQIAEHPGDPYGFEYLWLENPHPIYRIAASPPLFSYFLALASGFRAHPPEWWIHLSLVPFSGLAVLSFYSIARKFGHAPAASFVGAAWLAVTPAYLVMQNMAIPDLAALALFLAGFCRCLSGWRSGKLSTLIFAGILLAAAALTRYSIVTILPFVLVFGWTYPRKLRAAVPFSIALTAILLWMVLSRAWYGESHVGSLLKSHFLDDPRWLGRFLALSAHFALAGVLFPFVLLGGERKKLIGATVAALAVVTSVVRWIGPESLGMPMRPFPDLIYCGLGMLSIFYFGIWSGGALIARWRWNPAAESMAELRTALTFLWFLGALALPLLYLFFAAKYLIPALPPFLLFLLFLFRSKTRLWLGVSALAIPISWVLAMGLAYSDFQWAEAYRQAAKQLVAEARSQGVRAHFTGRWGLQYYLEEAGAAPLPMSEESFGRLQDGDLVFQPEYAAEPRLFPPLQESGILKLKRVRKIPKPGAFLTLSPPLRASFYANVWGILPYTFGSAPAEAFRYYVVELEGRSP